jgi:hypothetical protein
VSEQRLLEPAIAELEQLTDQARGLLQQLGALVTRRNEAIAERASRHVAAIVEAAEKSAADIRAGAGEDAAAIREKLAADANAEVRRIRADAETDAVRIRAEAHGDAVLVRERALVDASSEIESVCRRLTAELRTRAGAAKAVPSAPVTHTADDVQDAVNELEGAAAILEQLLLNARASGDQPEGANAI